VAKNSKDTKADIKIRLTEGLRSRIERTAKQRGVSMNAEMIERLENSFVKQGLLKEVLTLAYGPQWAAFLSDADAAGVLRFREEDKEVLRKRVNAFIDALPEKEKGKRS